MSNDDDLRGSTPVYTAKDVLVRLDQRVENMDSSLGKIGTSLEIIASQKLNDRLTALERDGSRTAMRAQALAEKHEVVLQQLSGARNAIRAMLGTSVISVVASAAAILKALGWF